MGLQRQGLQTGLQRASNKEERVCVGDGGIGVGLSGRVSRESGGCGWGRGGPGKWKGTGLQGGGGDQVVAPPCGWDGISALCSHARAP